MKVNQLKRTNLLNNKIHQLTLPELNIFQRKKKFLNYMTPYQVYKFERDKSFKNVQQKPKGLLRFNFNIHHYNSNPYLLNLRTEDNHNIKRRSVIQKDFILKKFKSKEIEKKKNVSTNNFLRLDIKKCTFTIKKSFNTNTINKTLFISSSVQTE